MPDRDEMTADHGGPAEPPSAASKLFDLRAIIAMLFGVYGIILTIMGTFFVDEAQLVKEAGININLWVGIVMLVVAALFLLWARLRPLAPPR
jgi:prolipoprotein diacylglyceryltransferase